MDVVSHSCWKPLEIAALATRALPWESLHAATRDAASNTVGGSESAEPTSASQERKRDSAAPDSTARVAAIHRHRLLANYSESVFRCAPRSPRSESGPSKSKCAYPNATAEVARLTEPTVRIVQRAALSATMRVPRGEVAERLNAPVLKTGGPSRGP